MKHSLKTWENEALFPLSKTEEIESLLGYKICLLAITKVVIVIVYKNFIF